MVAQCAHHRLADDDLRTCEQLVGTQAVFDFRSERHRERILFERRAVLPGARLGRCKDPTVSAAGGSRERDRTCGRLARTLFREPPVASESPRTVDEDTDADPLALGV